MTFTQRFQTFVCEGDSVAGYGLAKQAFSGRVRLGRNYEQVTRQKFGGCHRKLKDSILPYASPLFYGATFRE